MERLYDKDYEKHLFRLNELENFKVSEDEPDIRGWKVVGQDGNTVGKVDELIVDPNQKKVRYIDVNIGQQFSKGNADRHLLIPIGATRIHEKEDNILIQGINEEKLKRCPVLEQEPITRDYEHSLTDSLLSGSGKKVRQFGPKNKNNFYDNEIFDDEGFFQSLKKRIN